MPIQKNYHYYKDVSLSFDAHPNTSDVMKSVGEEAIKQSIVNLLMTSKYDVPFNPERNGGIRELLFEPASPITASALQSRILNALSAEIRIEVFSVVVKLADENKYIVEIEYSFRNLPTANILKFYLNRIR